MTNLILKATSNHEGLNKDLLFPNQYKPLSVEMLFTQLLADEHVRAGTFYTTQSHKTDEYKR